MSNKGRDLEDRVKESYEALLSAQGVPALVAARVSIKDTHGIARNFDVMYEFPLAGLTHRVVIECKYWETKNLDIGKLGEFYEKFKSIENTIGVVVSLSDLQEGARKFAESRRIRVIKPAELPDVFKITRDKLAGEFKRVALPGDNAPGQPFFVILEYKNGEITGSWHAISTTEGNKFPLFISKKDAEIYIKDKGLTGDFVSRGSTKNLISGMKFMGKSMGVAGFLLLLRPFPESPLTTIPISFDYIEDFLS